MPKWASCHMFNAKRPIWHPNQHQMNYLCPSKRAWPNEHH
jgi:hypothetical protein